MDPEKISQHLPFLKGLPYNWGKNYARTILRVIATKILMWVIGLSSLAALVLCGYFYLKHVFSSKEFNGLRKAWRLAEFIILPKTETTKLKNDKPFFKSEEEKPLQAYPELGSFLRITNLASAGLASMGKEFKKISSHPLSFRKNQSHVKLMNSQEHPVPARKNDASSGEEQIDLNGAQNNSTPDKDDLESRNP